MRLKASWIPVPCPLPLSAYLALFHGDLEDRTLIHDSEVVRLLLG